VSDSATPLRKGKDHVTKHGSSEGLYQIISYALVLNFQLRMFSVGAYEVNQILIPNKGVDCGRGFRGCCWLPIAAARIRAQVRSCGICGGQTGTGAGFLRVLRFPLPIFIPSISPLS
jgi:hypothetical protein